MAEVGLDRLGLWFGEVMVHAMSLPCPSADMDIGCGSATPVQPQRQSLDNCSRLG